MACHIRLEINAAAHTFLYALPPFLLFCLDLGSLDNVAHMNKASHFS